jgi:tetratricopeptide (TPR) repeat protein
MRRNRLAICVAIALTQLSLSAVILAEDHTQALQSFLAEAREAQSRKDFHAAAESYRKAIELEPSIPELWTNLGLMYHESGESSEAIQSFRQAIRLKPSLFVPQLFLGIEYLESKHAELAVPHLEDAARLNPHDVQVALSLGRAYSMQNHGDRAAESYLRAIELTPNDGNAWLALGIAYLQQVEDDARVMTSTYGDSSYVKLRAAEVFSEQGKLVQAEDAFKTAIASPSPVPCRHAELGIVLLRKKKIAEAREEFDLENRSGSHCALGALGVAVADLAEGHPELALNRLSAIATADPGFVLSGLPLFRDVVSDDQIKSLVNLAKAQTNGAASSVDLVPLLEGAFLSDASSATMSKVAAGRVTRAQSLSPANAELFYAAGQYADCDKALKAELPTLRSSQLQHLAECSFASGDFETASMVAERLKTNSSTRVQGLYWESKADQKLAIGALSRASEIDADSPRMHVLIGDVFRQKRKWDNAEAEYRKAVNLDPESRVARLSLAIVLFSELKTDEAFEIDRFLLREDANDPEANLLAGEILVQRSRFAEAEPYLLKCTNLKPEFMPRVHALLGQVYAETNRIPAAIEEYKSGLSTDEDGSLHYQLGRLYQKQGDRNTAQQAFAESQRLRRQWDNRARIALEESSTDISRQ